MTAVPELFLNTYLNLVRRIDCDLVNEYTGNTDNYAYCNYLLKDEIFPILLSLGAEKTEDGILIGDFEFRDLSDGKQTPEYWDKYLGDKFAEKGLFCNCACHSYYEERFSHSINKDIENLEKYLDELRKINEREPIEER